MSLITEEIRSQIQQRVADEVCKKYFSVKDRLSDVRASKIRQNVCMDSHRIVGMTIHRDDIDELIKIWVDQYTEAVVSKGGAVGIEAGQSLVQPIIQGMLKSQHKTGNKQNMAGANSIEYLNKLKAKIKVVRMHLTDNKITHRYLTDRYVEIKMRDVLVSSMGNSKVKIVPFKKEIYNNSEYIFINPKIDQPHPENQPLYQFMVDADKLYDAGITMIHIIQTLLKLNALGVTFVIHPLSKLRFDIIKLDNMIMNDAAMLSTLENTTIKGVAGLEQISKYTITMNDAVELRQVPKKDGTVVTRAYIDAYHYTQFPINELKRRIITKSKSIATPTYESLSLLDMDSILYLEYDEPVELSKETYSYYYVQGDIKISTLLEHLGKYINRDYLTTNDPHEMIEIYGRGPAMTHHEMLYSEELEATDTVMLYQHISLICAYMFAYDLNPISPAGYLHNKGVTALERFAFEQYPENLGLEAVKGTISNTKSIGTSIFTGNVANIGTAYIQCQILQDERAAIMEEYKIAYEKQLYDNAYRGIDLPVFDGIKMRSELKSGVGNLVNNINPFN